MKKLTEKQTRWVYSYVKLGDATAAAREAGYSPVRAKQMGWVNLHNEHVIALVNSLLADQRSKAVADAQEVLEFLTSVMRGETKEDVVVTEGCGDGISQAKIIEKGTAIKDRIKAAEGLAKRYGLDAGNQDNDALERLDSILDRIGAVMTDASESD